MIDIPSSLKKIMKHQKVACLARQVAVANFETIWFAQKANRKGCYPVILEYPEDRFQTCNKDKVEILKVTFFKGKGKRGGNKILKELLVENLREVEGVPFSQIFTKKGESIISFHQSLFRKIMPEIPIIKVSSWLKEISNGNGARGYYYYFLKIFSLPDLTLFEDFLESGSEKKFTETVVKPAMERLREEGFSPKIRPLLPPHSREREEWGWIPESREVVPLLMKELA